MSRKKKPSGRNRPAQNTQNKNATAKKTAHGKSVEIFTASFCEHCHDAKFYFRLKKIKFTEYNLERSKEAEKKFKSYGGKAIPLIIVKGKVLRRWDQKAFEAVYFRS